MLHSHGPYVHLQGRAASLTYQGAVCGCSCTSHAPATANRRAASPKPALCACLLAQHHTATAARSVCQLSVIAPCLFMLTFSVTGTAGHGETQDPDQQQGLGASQHPPHVQAMLRWVWQYFSGQHDRKSDVETDGDMANGAQGHWTASGSNSRQSSDSASSSDSIRGLRPSPITVSGTLSCTPAGADGACAGKADGHVSADAADSRGV